MFLINAHPVSIKGQSLRIITRSSNNGLLLKTEVGIIGKTPEELVAISGHQSLRSIRPVIVGPLPHVCPQFNTSLVEPGISVTLRPRCRVLGLILVAKALDGMHVPPNSPL